ncbi:CEP55 protein, partial [Centropus bengalensis]|nr:CEP55 protein [Centropus bengalensis]
MSAKAAKEIITGKWGLKSGGFRAGNDPERDKQEPAAPRKPTEEAARGRSGGAEAERSGPREKMLSLEKEKYSYLLGEKDKEIQNLKDKLRSKTKNSEVSSLRSQLEEKTKEAEKREQLLHSLSEEMNRLKCTLSSVSAKCSELESRVDTSPASQEALTNPPGSPTELYEVEKQLKDALEKNQQWLLYDQQREAYVRGLLGRIFELEQKSQIISQRESNEFNSQGCLQEEKQKYYDHLLPTAKNDLESVTHTKTQQRSELYELQRKYEEAQEMLSLKASLQLQQAAEMKILENENKMKEEKVQRLKQENESLKEQLREEKKRSEDLLCQVQLLHKSLLKQQKEHSRMALLEQRMQICITDFENEKLDRQNLQHQLNTVLEELRETREHLTRVEPLKLQEYGRVEPQEEKLTTYDKSPSLKPSGLLDRSFLECPKCKVQYPTSQHRELVAHVDFCTA